MIFFIAMLGCSVKGTVELMKAERAYDVAEEKSLVDSDEFNWTMADAYIKKAREEYANSNYEMAGILARKCQESLDKIEPNEDASQEESSEKTDPENGDEKSAEVTTSGEQ